MMLHALTLHHLWVGTGAWAPGYKRPGGVQCMLPDPSQHYVWTHSQCVDLSGSVCPEARGLDFTLAAGL